MGTMHFDYVGVRSSCTECSILVHKLALVEARTDFDRYLAASFDASHLADNPKTTCT